jgi:hypothetical protein
MDAWIFWCTPCKTHHAGECPPAAPPASDLHDWHGGPMSALSRRHVCLKCGMLSEDIAVDPTLTPNLPAAPPAGGCIANQPGPTPPPHVDQLIKFEVRTQQGPWSLVCPTRQYEVRSVLTKTNELRYALVGDITERTISLDAWTSHTDLIGSLGTAQIRVRPAP